MFNKNNEKINEYKTQVLTIETLTNGYWLRENKNTYTPGGAVIEMIDIRVAKSKEELISMIEKSLIDVLENEINEKKKRAIGFLK